jgi:folate-dependent phosphoribosylglycinamide formyltransferase PurN
MRPWVSGHAAMLTRQVLDVQRNARTGLSDAAHLAAAADWVARAHDAATDGGIIGRYRLDSGWTSSYPETTGYLIPTLLALRDRTGEEHWRVRAERAVRFLLELQLPSGAFPGGEVHEGTDRASIFNTAQILNGLVAWHGESGCVDTHAAIVRAANWLCDMQDADGAWRQHIYNGVVTTYTAHASCWLAEAGVRLAEPRWLQAAERHMDWVLSHRDPVTGWIDLMGFSPADHAARRSVTHTIAYTYWGVLFTALLLDREDAIDAVVQAADGIARRVQLTGWLPGMLDRNWRSAASYACLTGNAQMALIWLRLYALRGDGRHLNAALIALDAVKATQSFDNQNGAIRGAIAGSWPVWGGYISNAYPNWAAKFFIDALIAAEQAVGSMRERPARPLSQPVTVSGAVPEPPAGTPPTTPLRVVLLAGAYTHKVAQMTTFWRALGVPPLAVVVEVPPITPVWSRFARRVRADGLSWIRGRLGGAVAQSAHDSGARSAGDAEGWETDVRAYCAREGIPCRIVPTLDSDAGVATLTALVPDLCVHAGAGILRARTLGVPRLGTLNAHMGRLPAYRGMNVTEWSIFHRDRTGCSVHLIDPGIDTGLLITVLDVDTHDCRSLSEARRRVDEAQVSALGSVVAYVCRTGALPAVHQQRPADGRQFFRMHPRIRAALDAELSAS